MYFTAVKPAGGVKIYSADITLVIKLSMARLLDPELCSDKQIVTWDTIF